MSNLKVGDIVRTNCERRKWKDLRGMKILKIPGDGEYCVVDNTKDIGDGVISVTDLEIDVEYYRQAKLERICSGTKK